MYASLEEILDTAVINDMKKSLPSFAVLGHLNLPKAENANMDQLSISDDRSLKFHSMPSLSTTENC